MNITRHGPDNHNQNLKKTGRTNVLVVKRSLQKCFKIAPGHRHGPALVNINSILFDLSLLY
jgi:hypothetical protein